MLSGKQLWGIESVLNEAFGRRAVMLSGLGEEFEARRDLRRQREESKIEADGGSHRGATRRPATPAPLLGVREAHPRRGLPR